MTNKTQTQKTNPKPNESILEAVRKAKTREELYKIIEPFTDLPEPSLPPDCSPEGTKKWIKFRYVVGEAASKIYRENPKLPEPPTGTNIPIMTVANWCVKPQAKPEKQSRQRKNKELLADDKLTAVLIAHQDWSFSQICLEAGISRTWAYKCEKFMYNYKIAHPEKRGEKTSYRDKDARQL